MLFKVTEQCRRTVAHCKCIGIESLGASKTRAHDRSLQLATAHWAVWVVALSLNYWPWDPDLNPVLPMASSATKLAISPLFVSDCTLTGFAANDNLLVPVNDLSNYIYLFVWIHCALLRL